MGDQAISGRQARIWLWAILALAVALRIWTFRPYAIHHPDELYQYLEPAHRLIFGQGIVSWEYRAEMRSWLPPLLLSLPMRLGEALSPGSQLPVILTRACVAAISLVPVVAAYALGSRMSRLHGLVAAAVLAVWYGNVFFTGHVLTEVLAVACFLPAAALIKPDASRRAMATAGALLGLAVLLRFHYAPALALFALVALGRRWSLWKPLIAGGVAVLAVAGLIDVGMGQAPFGWILANIDQNLIKGAADRFGTSGPLAYLQLMFVLWGAAAFLLLSLPALVARRYPALLCAALANLLVHMAIGHKEYRFIWLTVEIMVLLSAIASAELLSRAVDRWKLGARAHLTGAALLIAGWAGLSATLAAKDILWGNWNRFGARMAAMADAGRQPGMCAVAVHDLDYWSASYTYLRRDVPIYLPWRRGPAEEARALAANKAAYDVIMAPQGSSAEIPAEYRSVGCREDGKERVCLFRRPGGCVAESAQRELLQNVIVRHNY